MTQKLSRRRALAAVSFGGAASLSGLTMSAQGFESDRGATSAAYGLVYTHPLEQLIGDLTDSERGDPHRESEVPHRDWYSQRERRRMGSWGPKARTYPPLPGLEARPLEWKRERVIATAARFIGYGYQHHHIPDWDPPADWPWQSTCVGHNGKGFDCSNFTSFVYNQGFGIRVTAAVADQSNVHRAFESSGRAIELRRIELPKDLAGRQEILRTGDLLYIRGREDGPVTHVVIWVGAVGRSTSGVPLVMDSHGPNVRDDEGRSIPCGVQLRPFRAKSWYSRCASHAHRIFHKASG
jgi:cell wall-associated NlpC family hydrolase